MKKIKTALSIFMAVLMFASIVVYVLVFFSQPPSTQARPEFRLIWENMPDDVKSYYINTLGITVVNYPENDSYFQTTLYSLPKISGGYVVINLGEPFSIESAKGFRKTSVENLTNDLCMMMSVQALPDCLINK